MANGMDQLGALFDWIRRGRPQAAEAPSRVGQFAMMPQGGLMGGGWDAAVAPPIPQQMPPEQLQQMQAMEAYRLLGGGAPPPLPQQAPLQDPNSVVRPSEMQGAMADPNSVVRPSEMRAVYERMRRNARNVNPLTSMIDGTRRSRAGF